MRRRIGVVAREHEETDRAATGRVISAMAAIADRIVAGFQPLRVIPFGRHP